MARSPAARGMKARWTPRALLLTTLQAPDEAIAALRDTHEQMLGGFRPRKMSFGRGAA